MRLLELWYTKVAFTKPLILKRGLLSEREVFLIKLELGTASVWVEVAPLPGWSSDNLADNLVAIKRVGSAPFDLDEIAESSPPALSAALWLGSFLSVEQRGGKVESNCLITSTETFHNDGSSVLKLKVGVLPLADDIHRIQSILDALRPGQKLRLDANQSFQIEGIQALVASLTGVEKIDYIEEPLSADCSYEDWESYSSIPYAIDETLLNNAELVFPERSLPKALILKPSVLGGVLSHKLLKAAQTLDLQTVISSSFETEVGLGALNALANRVAPETVHGLATRDYLVGSLSSDQDTFPLTNTLLQERLL